MCLRANTVIADSLTQQLPVAIPVCCLSRVWGGRVGGLDFIPVSDHRSGPNVGSEMDNALADHGIKVSFRLGQVIGIE